MTGGLGGLRELVIIVYCHTDHTANICYVLIVYCHTDRTANIIYVLIVYCLTDCTANICYVLIVYCHTDCNAIIGYVLIAYCHTDSTNIFFLFFLFFQVGTLIDLPAIFIILRKNPLPSFNPKDLCFKKLKFLAPTLSEPSKW